MKDRARFAPGPWKVRFLCYGDQDCYVFAMHARGLSDALGQGTFAAVGDREPQPPTDF